MAVFSAGIVIKYVGYPRLIIAMLASLGAAAALPAAPPVSVGDSFFAAGAVSPMGHENFGMYYLGSDGSCTRLSSTSIIEPGFPGGPNSNPSVSGTYTYVLTPGAASGATLTFNLGTTTVVYTLYFIGDTNGSDVESDAPASNGTFDFYLPAANPFLANVSNRVTLHPGDTAITGFVITGGAGHLVLIRAVGPTLAQFGVSPVSANPVFGLYKGTGTDLIASGQAWGSVTGYDVPALNQIFGVVGAFSLEAGSNDQVYFGMLAPGAYTIQTSDSTVPAGGASVLTEVYILPYLD
jgi:hypothetical protein